MYHCGTGWHTAPVVRGIKFAHACPTVGAGQMHIRAHICAELCALINQAPPPSQGYTLQPGSHSLCRSSVFGGHAGLAEGPLLGEGLAAALTLLLQSLDLKPEAKNICIIIMHFELCVLY